MSERLLTPEHIGFIMDGNGRWAQQRHRPRTFGHRKGLMHLRDVMEYCADFGVRIITAYVFSTENWNRPETEVRILMNLIRTQAPKLARELNENGVQLRHVGSREGLSDDILRIIDDAVALTKDNDDYIANIAFNYGSREELVAATKRIIQDGLKPEEVTEEVISRYLYTGDLPDPDLIVRTGGGMRLSNFLLWQAADTAFYVTDVFWPDFSKKELLKAIELYSRLHTEEED